jgi:zinc protease
VLLSLLAAPMAIAQDELWSGGLDNVHVSTLPNGLDVVVIEDHSVPIVTVELAVHNGAMTEPPELSGLSHLYEHMFFKGNQAIPNQEAYLARQRELGMTWNGTTGEERVNYFFTLGSARLCEGMVFMSNAIRTPLFDPAELEREREVVLGEYDRNEADPYYHLQQAVAEALWFEYPNRKDPLGTRETISTATVDQMRFMQTTYYVPNNAALFLAGDVTPEQGVALAEEIFAEWEAAPDPFELHPIPQHPALPESTSVVVEQPVQALTVMMAWQGPRARQDTDSTFAADVFSYIISQESHRFQQNLVDSGLLLGVSLCYYTQAETGPSYLFGQMIPTQAEAALRAIRDEITHFTDPDYFTDEQIEAAKTMLAVQELYSREQTTSWVHTVSFWWAVTGIDYYRDYVPNLREVTREDIIRYIETYIQDQPYVLGTLVAPEVRQAMGLTPEGLLGWSQAP